jgi:hypothetical protein
MHLKQLNQKNKQTKNLYCNNVESSVFIAILPEK